MARTARSTNPSASPSEAHYQANPMMNGFSLNNLLSFINQNFGILFIVALFFIGGFFAGSLWMENQVLKKGGVGVGTGGTVATDPTAPAPPSQEQLTSITPISADDYVRGNPNADIVFYEYSDFECPFCARFHPAMNEIVAEYGDQVAWVYRHFPLSFHPNAQKAGEAAECVAETVNKAAFWEFADAIFEKQNELGGRLTPEAITEVAVAVGAPQAAFQTCLDSGRMAERVTADMAEGSAAGVTGTPNTIVINGDGFAELIPGAVDAAQIRAIVEKNI